MSHLPKAKWRLAERVGGKAAAWRMTWKEVWGEGEETVMQVTCSPGCVTARCCHQNVFDEYIGGEMKLHIDCGVMTVVQDAAQIAVAP